MKREISILMIEDDVQDAELIRRQLSRNGLEFTCRRVFTRENFLKELKTRQPDIIFSDHGLPAFSGYEARALARQQFPEIPFIFVTGGIPELPTEDIDRTDTEYVLKNELTKLPGVVRRILGAQEPPKDTAPEAPVTRQSIPPATTVSRATEHAVLLTDPSGLLVSWDAGATRLLGHEPREMIGKPFSSLFPWRAVERRIPEQLIQMSTRAEGYKGELLFQRRDASQFWATVSIHPVRSQFNSTPAAFSIVIHDLDDHKRLSEK